jgi:hypothetical protein
MNELEVVSTCPLGHVCEEAKDGKIHRCLWYVKIIGRDPQSMKEYDEWGCAMVWQPLLSIEMARTNQGQTAAIESFRNEMVKGNAMLLGSVNQRRLEDGDNTD